MNLLADIPHGDMRWPHLQRWFDHWLKDAENGIMDEPPVSVFTLGENRWQSLADWPPPKPRPGKR